MAALRTNAVRNWSPSLGGTIWWYSTTSYSKHPPSTTARVRTPGTQTKCSRGARPAQASCGVPLLHSNFMSGAKHFYSAPCDGKRLHELLSRITTLGFLEHALPRMYLDCSLEKSPKATFMTRPAVPSDSDLQAQLSLQSRSTTWTQRSLHTQERSIWLHYTLKTSL